MNRKANVMTAVMMALIFFMAGALVINFIKDDITISRNSANLDCANDANISDGTKITCLLMDAAIPYIFIAIFSLIGGIVTEKFLK